MKLPATGFRSTLLALVWVALGLWANTSARAQAITLCALSVPKEIQQAHASFNAIYGFDVDSRGKPINLKPIESQFTNPKDVESCLDRLSLTSLPATHLVAIFEWQHGKGWTKIAISGPGVELTIHLAGCPHCAKGTEVPAAAAKPTPTTH